MRILCLEVFHTLHYTMETKEAKAFRRAGRGKPAASQGPPSPPAHILKVVLTWGFLRCRWQCPALALTKVRGEMELQPGDQPKPLAIQAKGAWREPGGPHLPRWDQTSSTCWEVTSNLKIQFVLPISPKFSFLEVDQLQTQKSGESPCAGLNGGQNDNPTFTDQLEGAGAVEERSFWNSYPCRSHPSSLRREATWLQPNGFPVTLLGVRSLPFPPLGRASLLLGSELSLSPVSETEIRSGVRQRRCPEPQESRTVGGQEEVIPG